MRPMAGKRAKLSDKLRAAIKAGDKSRYRLSKETGIANAVLSKFVNRKGGLSMEGIDKLAEALGLDLVAPETRRKGK